VPDRPKSQIALGRAIKQIRKREGLTQEDVACRTGYHLTWISRIETQSRNTGWDTVKRVADALGVSLVEIAASAERIELE
jgi:transcriptional regulator with XRE-family HTH domain